MSVSAFNIRRLQTFTACHGVLRSGVSDYSYPMLRPLARANVRDASQRRRPSACLAFPSRVLAPVLRPPCIRHRRLPGTARALQAPPTRVPAPQTGRSDFGSGLPWSLRPNALAFEQVPTGQDLQRRFACGHTRPRRSVRSRSARWSSMMASRRSIFRQNLLFHISRFYREFLEISREAAAHIQHHQSEGGNVEGVSVRTAGHQGRLGGPSGNPTNGCSQKRWILTNSIPPVNIGGYHHSTSTAFACDVAVRRYNQTGLTGDCTHLRQSDVGDLNVCELAACA